MHDRCAQRPRSPSGLASSAEVGEAIVAPGQMTYGSQAAAASQVFEQQRDLALRDRATAQLALVEAALARLDDGSFGACLRCGKPIAAGAARGAAVGRRTASTARRDVDRGAPPMPTRRSSRIDDIRAAALAPARRRDPDAARPVRTARGPALPQGRVAPADRRLQDPRRLRGGLVAAGGRAGARRHHLLVREPRPGRRAGGPAAGHPGRGRHASRRPGDQARARRGGRRRGHRGRHRQRGAADRRRAAGRRAVAGRSSRPSTTTGSSPARARSASSSLEDLPDLAAVLVPIGGGGLASGIATAVKALRPSARVVGVEPELAADARNRWARARSSSGRRSDVSRTIADGTRTQAIGAGRSPISARILDAIVTVSEAEIAAGVRLAAEGVAAGRRAVRRAVDRGDGVPRGRAGVGGARRTGRGGGQRRQRRPGALPRVPGGADLRRG